MSFNNFIELSDPRVPVSPKILHPYILKYLMLEIKTAFKLSGDKDLVCLSSKNYYSPKLHLVEYYSQPVSRSIGTMTSDVLLDH